MLATDIVDKVDDVVGGLVGVSVHGVVSVTVLVGVNDGPEVDEVVRTDGVEDVD